MRLLPTLFAVALAVILSAAVEAAPQVGGKKGKKNHPVRGVVVAVQKDKDADSGTITVKVHHKKKTAAAAARSVERTFQVTNATQFEKVRGKKGQQQTSPTTFRHVHQGEHVTILHQGDTAQEVRIHARGTCKGVKAVKR
jgi:hypothetical protein